MEFGSGNPYLQGENPFMQGQPGEPPVNGAPNAQTPASGGMLPDAGGTSQTTKPRQMPGGSDPMGGMPGAAPAIPPGDTNTPQPGMDAKATLRAVRADIKASNPDLTVHDAHVIALRVVALIAEGASPMGPAPKPPQYSDPTRQQQAGQPRRTRLNLDPRDPNSPAHPEHPQHRQYQMWMRSQQRGQQQFHAPEEGEQGKGWQSQFGGRTPLEDRAYMRGYQGQNPNLFGLADTAVEMFRQRNKGKQPPATRNGTPGARQLP